MEKKIRYSQSWDWAYLRRFLQAWKILFFSSSFLLFVPIYWISNAVLIFAPRLSLSPSFFPSLSDHSSFRPYLLPFKVNCRRQTRLISMHLHSLCCHSLCRVFSSWSRVEMLSINIYINNNHTWKTYVNVASTSIIMKWFSIMNALM